MTDLKFKAGDHVMVPAVVEETDGPDAYRVKLDDGFRVWVSVDALASATLIERPLAVGDRAIASGALVEILGIDGDFVWIKYLGVGTYSTAILSELRRAEERG